MRVKAATSSDRKYKKLFSITKGFFGRKKNNYRRAREAYLHALTSMFKDRRRKKRDFRRLWISRINAAARMEGMSYSFFMNGLKKAGIEINRKMLADLAVNDMAAFRAIAEQAKAAATKEVELILNLSGEHIDGLLSQDDGSLSVLFVPCVLKTNGGVIR